MYEFDCGKSKYITKRYIFSQINYNKKYIFSQINSNRKF